MKKIGWLLLAAALLLGGCNTSSTSNSGGKRPDVSGIYDITLTPAPGPVTLYVLAVERGGGSGAAMVSVTGPASAETVTVTAGASVDLGPCGLWVVFGDTAGFNLAAGDGWRVYVAAGSPASPVADGGNSSTAGKVESGGLDICAPPVCDGSALSSAVPASANPLGGGGGAGGQWQSVRLAQSGAELSAMVPEQHVLSLNLSEMLIAKPPFLLPALASPGDTVTVTFRRRMDADGTNGDFFRATAANGAQTLDLEYLWGASVNAGDTTVSLTYVSQSSLGRLDFIVGLSDQGEDFILDSVMVSTASAGVVLAEHFETSGGGCVPAGLNAARWSLRGPVWSVGNACISAQGALAGSYSERWNGGSYRRITGSVLIGGSSSGLSELLGGGSSPAGAVPGIMMEAWEPVWSGYFTSIAAAQQGPGVLAGTFRGESENHDCVEQGTLTATAHREQETDLSSRYWVLRLQGNAINCEPALAAGNTIAFDETLTTPAGDTIAMLQVGQVLVSADVPTDVYGNPYALGGLVNGSLLTFTLANPLLNTRATGLGVIYAKADQIAGALTGTRAFDAGRVCEITGGSAFTLDLVDK